MLEQVYSPDKPELILQRIDKIAAELSLRLEIMVLEVMNGQS